MRTLISTPSFREGVRVGLPLSIASLVLAISFGVVARPVLGLAATIVFSAIVFAGSAQFGAVAVLAAGGGPLAAVLAGVLLNSRYLPMGIALAPSLNGGLLRRALVGQGMVDFSWAAANRGGGRFDAAFMLGATAPAYPAWVSGTAIGALLGDLLGNPDALGLDAIFPAFFLALLVNGEVSGTRRSVLAAVGGAVIAVALIPFTPPGVPVVAACLVALIGLERSKRQNPVEQGVQVAEEHPTP